jgi:hypothetical protein
MPLGYRSSSALAAITAQPDAGNREVADAAGVSDEAQISKLLARLAGLSLVENTGEGQSKGAANAWSLTRKDREVLNAVRTCV